MNATKFKEGLLFAPIYWMLAFINLKAKLNVTSTWYDGNLANSHTQLLAFNYTNNEQSRLFQFYMPELFRRLFGYSIEQAYLFNRWLFVFLAFWAFHLYLRKWFNTGWSAAGVFFLAAVMPITYMNDLQESSALLMLVFLLILWSVRAKNAWAFAGTMLLGALTNETALVLGLAWVVNSLEDNRWTTWIKRSLLGLWYSTPAFVATAVIRYINRDRPHLGDPRQWYNNWGGIYRHLQLPPIEWLDAWYLYPFFIFGALWVYAWFGWKPSRDRMILAGLSVVPFFILPHMITGIIFESRQMVPLAFVIIPAAWFWLHEKFPTAEDKG
jgi:hypothetical protein